MTHPMRPLALAFVLLCALAVHAAEPVAPAGTNWSGDGTIKGKLQGLGTIAGPVDILVDFGPNPGLSLDSNEFRVTIDDGMVAVAFEGTYGTDAKGQPVLVADGNQVALALRDLANHVCEDVLVLGAECDALVLADIGYTDEKFRFKAKTAAGDGDAALTFSGKLPFDLVVSDVPLEVLKGGFSFKTSPPAVLVK
jgi:hypothetical protein